MGGPDALFLAAEGSLRNTAARRAPVCFEHDLFRKPESTFRDHARGRISGELSLN